MIAMLTLQQYNKLAQDYSVDIAIAEWEGDLYPHYTNIRKMPDEMKVIALTNFIIRNGIYQQVHRELHRLQNKYKNKKIKESTLYEKAINNVVEKYQIDIE